MKFYAQKWIILSPFNQDGVMHKNGIRSEIKDFELKSQRRNMLVTFPVPRNRVHQS